MADPITKLYWCEKCPIRCRAAKQSGSAFARIHRWHSTWWPGWKVYQAELRARSANSARSAKAAESA